MRSKERAVVYPVLALSTLLSAEGASAEETATILTLRSAETGAAVESYVLIEDGALRVPPSALRDLGMRVGQEGEFISLDQIEGLDVALDAAAGEATLSCGLSCYRVQRIGAAQPSVPDASVAPGAFLNVDLALSAVERAQNAAGAFEFGVFGAGGASELSWTVGARGGAEVVRLETRWTFDDPRRRVRYRVGDSIVRPGATGAPYRFGGFQIARDFSLDPRFVTFPAPSLSGTATAPSVVDLYVDGALRLREEVDGGPFDIVDPPLVTGAGQAQVVVTDALGRRQVTTAPFYASRQLLKPGLTDYSVAVGALRGRFAVDSADYGEAFVSALLRRGLENGVTTELRGEAAGRQGAVGAGLSWASSDVGQFDVAFAASEIDGAIGTLLRAGYTREGRRVSIGMDAERASDDFVRLGVSSDTPRTRMAASVSGDTGLGVASVSLAHMDYRSRADVNTLAIDYTLEPIGRATFGLSLLLVQAETTEMTLGARLVRPIADGVSASGGVEARDGRWSGALSANAPPPSDGGLGWRAAVRSGGFDRGEVALRYETLRGFFEVEARRVDEEDGLRAQAAFALAWIDGGVYAARPIRESFALVDARAPGVRVTRDNRAVAVTDRNGRALVTDLRPYDLNRIGIELNDLPDGVPAAHDTITVTPAVRSGALVRFPVEMGAAGEVRVLDEAGAPLPAGAMLVREADGARFPVGDGGRVYLQGLTDVVALRRLGRESCVVQVSVEALSSQTPVVCGPGRG